MSAIKELILEIQAAAHDMGDDFGQDAETILTLSRVFHSSPEFIEQALAPDAEYDDSMDGDFDSAMASAGYGTDEDYGYYGE